MREILFRGKRLDNGEWVCGCLADYMRRNGKCIMSDSYFATRDFGEEDNHGNPIIENEMAIGGFVSVDPSTIGQFTGLTDKNGMKIFEGDIISEKGYKPMTVCFGEYGAGRDVFSMEYAPIGVFIKFFDGGEYTLNQNGKGYAIAANECEVIGNIHGK